MDAIDPPGPAGPDTLLGQFDPSGVLLDSNDDGSTIDDDGFGSGLSFARANSDGTVRLKVTGWTDTGFVGNHTESGDYLLEFRTAQTFNTVETVRATLLAGAVDEITFSDPSWNENTRFYADINNIVGRGDVDFFEFRGLIPNQTYIAETLVDLVADPDADTELLWLDATGQVLPTNLTRGVAGLSRVDVAADGQGVIRLAVTAGQDFDLNGSHLETIAAYELIVTLPGDYNGNGTVEQGDLDLVLNNWGRSYGNFENPQPGWVTQRPRQDFDGGFNQVADGTVDQNDLDAVLNNWGRAAAVSSGGGSLAVPEPGLGALALALGALLRRRREGVRR